MGTRLTLTLALTMVISSWSGGARAQTTEDPTEDHVAPSDAAGNPVTTPAQDVQTPPAPSDEQSTPGALDAQSSAVTEVDEPVQPAPRRFSLAAMGFIRAGLIYGMRDDDVDFIGANQGFALANARIGIDGVHLDSGFGLRLSVEGSSELRQGINRLEGTYDVRLRDAFIRWRRYAPGEGPLDPRARPVIELRVGQFRAPFSGEEARSTDVLPFVQRAVGEEGVSLGTGFEERGLDVRRQIGIGISTPAGLVLGERLRMVLSAAVTNGAGENQLLNDNRHPAFYLRAELERELSDGVLRFGLAGYHNRRTTGVQPDLFDERDVGADFDVLLDLGRLEFFAQVMYVMTEFISVDAPLRGRLAYHAQALYDFPVSGGWTLTPGYRYAAFRPWLHGAGAGSSLSDYQVQHHTVGARLWREWDDLRFSAYVQYTFSVEDDARELRNDRFEALASISF